MSVSVAICTCIKIKLQTYAKTRIKLIYSIYASEKRSDGKILDQTAKSCTELWNVKENNKKPGCLVPTTVAPETVQVK